MNVIGLTGGIACGKSTVAGMLVQKGALVIDADQLAREAVEPGEQAWKEIIQWLGDTVAGEDGSLDRKKIASIVFKDEKSLAKLNSIIHPRVLELFYQRSSELEKELPGRLLVWDIPLLFETDTIKELIILLWWPHRKRFRYKDYRQGMDYPGKRRFGAYVPSWK